jgi:copper(I)-binding protein
VRSRTKSRREAAIANAVFDGATFNQVNQETTMQHTIPLIAGVLGLALTAAFAGDVKVGSLSVSNPWSNVTPKGASVAAGYMNITNSGTIPDRLISGSADISAKLEIHNMTMENGVMKMRPVEGEVELKPGAAVEFKPGSLPHVRRFEEASDRQRPHQSSASIRESRHGEC